MFPRRGEATLVDDLVERGRVVDALAALRKPAKASAQRDARLPTLAAKVESLERLFAHMDSAVWGKPKGKEGSLLVWHHAKEHIHFFKAHIVLDVPPMDLLVIVREWDLVPTWNGRNVPRAIIMDEPSLVSLRAAAELWLPSPFSNRSVAFDAEGFDVLDSHGVLAIDFATTEGAMRAMPEQLAHLEHVAFVAPSGMRIVPRSSASASAPGARATSDRCEITWTMGLDPKTLPVPSWLVDFVMSIIAPFVHKELVKVVASIKGEYAVRKQQRNTLYGPLGARCDEHVQRRLAAEPRDAAAVSMGAPSVRPRRGFFESLGFGLRPPTPHHAATA
ncbi:hypothetical protein KFE25_006096 [Diacronema lutheri]|uniref:START domain-containing protein n=1 Tax=Diacronema lutheri TaxID=2081491 RepID=A0A8J6CG02_DIALT|nr:hypothetical protein KFE25_006096 [Diacronema lutheri]